ncbi:hypothetical protein [Gordonia sihwensis]|uniref:hypothetical protein n=1 Tax=Gordonia sihwensis TaxID=173559 RepID=UPI003D98F7CF
MDLTIDNGNYTPEEAQARIKEQLAEYLTSTEVGLITDYGPQTWGGYEGPFIVECSVAENGLIIGTYRSE